MIYYYQEYNTGNSLYRSGTERTAYTHTHTQTNKSACATFIAGQGITSCKSLEQPEVYSLTWIHKIHFPRSRVSLHSKKIKVGLKPTMEETHF